MTQDEINKREHENQANWSNPLGFYHSNEDSRLWVPKQRAWMGWTLNTAHPIARVIAMVLILAVCLTLTAVVYAVLPQE